MNNQLILYYECPICKKTWVDVWYSEIDAQCSYCGTKDIKPYYSEDPLAPKKIIVFVKGGVASLYIDNIENAEVRIYNFDNSEAGDDVEIGRGSDYPLCEVHIKDLDNDVEHIKKTKEEV
jgi:hypothetical protein